MVDNFASVICVGEPKNERCFLEANYDGANFYNTDGANNHNEERIGVRCDRGDLFNDTFNIKAEWGYFQGKLTSSHLAVSVNSEAYTDLWSDGTASFVYDFRTGHWKVYAKADGRDWKFCSPEGVINNIVAGLECFSRDDEITDQNAKKATLEYIRAFEADKNYMTSNAERYEEINDCHVESYQSAEPQDIYYGY